LDDKWQTASDRLEFLRDSNAELTLNFDKHGYDPRALQLVNKTNQFHLNGRRYSEAEWRSYLRLPESFVLVVSYRDKYGPLGKVAVLAGRRRARKLFIDVWAMSCRAFSRYIERRCLQEVLAQFDCDEVVFNYLETDKNQPLRNFLAELLHTCPAPHCAVSKSQLLAAWPPTSHTIRDLTVQRQVSAA
jgi:FkbH-like protein